MGQTLEAITDMLKKETHRAYNCTRRGIIGVLEKGLLQERG